MALCQHIFSELHNERGTDHSDDTGVGMFRLQERQGTHTTLTTERVGLLLRELLPTVGNHIQPPSHHLQSHPWNTVLGSHHTRHELHTELQTAGKPLSLTQFLRQFVAGGDLHVSKKSSVITGITILGLFSAISGLMVYFDLKIVPFLLSILAFFSLTTSYLIPMLHKLSQNRSKDAQDMKDSQLKQTLNEDVQVDVDFKEKRDEEQKNQILQDYFAQQGTNRSNDGKKHKEEGSKILRVFGLVVNSFLVLLFIGMYGLLAYNFIYNTIKL